MGGDISTVEAEQAAVQRESEFFTNRNNKRLQT
jgi:hypothetical protein